MGKGSEIKALGGVGAATRGTVRAQLCSVLVPACVQDQGLAGRRKPTGFWAVYFHSGAIQDLGSCLSSLLTHFHFRFNKSKEQSSECFILSKQICRNELGFGKRWAPKYTHALTPKGALTHRATSPYLAPEDLLESSSLPPFPLGVPISCFSNVAPQC